jgi:hypothetical protein
LKPLRRFWTNDYRVWLSSEKHVKVERQLASSSRWSERHVLDAFQQVMESNALGRLQGRLDFRAWLDGRVVQRADRDGIVQECQIAKPKRNNRVTEEENGPRECIGLRSLISKVQEPKGRFDFREIAHVGPGMGGSVQMPTNEPINARRQWHTWLVLLPREPATIP